jgi:hypothetical protein
MPTNWPTHVWNPQDPLADDQGMAPFSIMGPGTALLSGSGLTQDVYQEHKGAISDSSIRAWDVMENPFYQAMAEYEGHDWDDLVSKFNEEIGPLEEQSHSIQTQEATVIRIGGRWQNVAAEYENFDNYTDAVTWAEENDYDVSDIIMTSDVEHYGTGGTQVTTIPPKSGPNGPYGGGQVVTEIKSDDDDSRWWGITDKTWVERFDDWTAAGESLIKKYKRQDAPIIRQGPSAADYGIVRDDDNIFAHYGLDRPPADPTELATNYKWNLSKTWTSNASYGVPPDLKRVNLRGEYQQTTTSTET